MRRFGGKARPALRPGVQGAYQERDAGGQSENAGNHQPGHPLRPWRKHARGAVTGRGGKPAAPASRQCAKKELNNTHNHLATPGRSTRRRQIL